MIKMTYDELANPQFQDTIAKISGAEVSNAAACRIAKVRKAAILAVTEMGEAYKRDIEAKFPPLAATATPEEKATRETTLKPFVEKFGATTTTLDTFPLAPQHLSEIKLSAIEIEALGPLFDETGEVRTTMTKKNLGIA